MLVTDGTKRRRIPSDNLDSVSESYTGDAFRQRFGPSTHSGRPVGALELEPYRLTAVYADGTPE